MGEKEMATGKRGEIMRGWAAERGWRIYFEEFHPPYLVKSSWLTMLLVSELLMRCVVRRTHVEDMSIQKRNQYLSAKA